MKSGKNRGKLTTTKKIRENQIFHVFIHNASTTRTFLFYLLLSSEFAELPFVFSGPYAFVWIYVSIWVE